MILLIGSGMMAVEYASVLKKLGKKFRVVGRSEKSCLEFFKKTNHEAISGGLEEFIRHDNTEVYDSAIVAVNVEQLFSTTKLLIEKGISNILVEKPAALSINDINLLNELAEKYSSNVFIAYNRRFYASVLAAKSIITNDGGVTSFTFDITERSYLIEKIVQDKLVKSRWFLANSTHVVDLAFYLCGKPTDINCITGGEGVLPWHRNASLFYGSGRTKNNILFSYSGDWSAPGRWSLEVMTKNSRLIFSPMEKLKIQKIGSMAIEDINLEDELDTKFKPGLYHQTKSFIQKDFDGFCTLSDHLETFKIYLDMAGYSHDD